MTKTGFIHIKHFIWKRTNKLNDYYFLLMKKQTAHINYEDVMFSNMWMFALI